MDFKTSSGNLERTDSDKRLSSGGMSSEGGPGHHHHLGLAGTAVVTTMSSQTTRTSLFGGVGLETDRDFVMIDLKTPFAAQASSAEGSSTGGGDTTLGSFFKDVSAAPNLSSLPQAGLPFRETMTSWSSELTRFEADLQQYDDLLEECGSTSDIDS
jgi:hypothetical protein